MSGFALSGLAVAMRELNAAITSIETYCTVYEGAPGANSVMISEAYGDLLRCRGQIAAVQQLVELEHDLEKADTERPSSLRLVK